MSVFAWYVLSILFADGSIDYLAHYQLVKPSNLEVYGKAFLVEDNDENNIISMSETRVALEGIPALQVPMYNA